MTEPVEVPRDPDLLESMDMEEGWEAERHAAGAAWVRRRTKLDPEPL